MLNEFTVHHHMKMFVKLLFDGLNYFWMTVPDVAYSDTRYHIDITLSVRRVQVNAFSFFNSNQVRVIRGLCQVVQKYILIKVHSPKAMDQRKNKKVRTMLPDFSVTFCGVGIRSEERRVGKG